MKRAQDVAQAVVKTRSSLSSWSCIGPRRRVVHASSNSIISSDLTEAPLITERTSVSSICDVVNEEPTSNNVDHCSSNGSGSGDETEEEEELVEVDRVIARSTLEDDIAEGELWYELEKELRRQEGDSDSDIRAQVEEEEEAAVVEEITEEEKVLADAVESHTPISSSDVLDNQHFYPPGRIMHMVSVPVSVEDGDDDDDDFGGHDGPMKEHVGIYETPRELYSKLRLSRTMINDHYMPMYKKMMEKLIAELEEEV